MATKTINDFTEIGTVVDTDFLLVWDTNLSVTNKIAKSDLVNDKVDIGGDTMTGALIADDHGTAATDQVVNVSYGTSATPPTASTTTEGSLYVQYTA